MLSKNRRLNLRKEYRYVTSGRKFMTPSLTVFSRRADLVEPMVGIALAKAKFRQATDRNRARRLTSKAIEQLYSSLRPDMKLVIIPKSQVLDKTPDELKGELEDVKDLFVAD